MRGLRARLAFRWETLQIRLSRRRFGSWILFNLLAVVLLGAFVIFLLERRENPGVHNYFEALYMVFITIATVGYGDVSPVTVGGRVAIIVILVLGIGALSGFVTLMATKRAEKAGRRFSGLEEKTAICGHIVVCGWNSRGRFVIARLREETRKSRARVVLLCDLEEAPIADDDVLFLRGNPVSEADLERTNVAEAEAAILLADESKGGNSGDVDARTVLSALTIRSINPDIKMTAEVLEPENAHHLRLAGVKEILDTNSFLGNLIARSALHYGLIAIISGLVARDADTGVYTIPAGSDTAGRTWAEAEAALREEYGGQLLAISTRGRLRPEDAGYRVEEGDYLIVLAREAPPGALE